MTAGDESRLQRLMGALECAVVRFGDLNQELRYEAEFFRKRFLQEDAALSRLQKSGVGTFAKVTDGPHGYHEVDDASKVAMLTAKCASNWFADRHGADLIAEWVDEANTRSRLAAGDVILSTRGTVGMCALVIPEALPANIDQDVARISWTDRSEFLPEYVVTYLNSRYGQDHIDRYASGMVQQGMSLAKVRDIPVPRLSLTFQTAIAECISDALRLRREAWASLWRAEVEVLKATGLREWQPNTIRSYSAKASETRAASRIDAEYFHPDKRELLRLLATTPSQPLHEHYVAIREMFDPGTAAPSALVRNFDLTDALEPFLDDDQPPTSASEIGSAKKRLKPGDVVISRLRAYLREIAIVRTSPSIASVGSSEFIVLRARSETPRLTRAALLVFLRSAPVQTILKWSQDGSHHPRFSEEDLMSIHVPDAVCEAAPMVETLYDSILIARAKAKHLLATARTAVERAIEDSEGAALELLASARS